MPPRVTLEQRFRATVEDGGSGRVFLVVPSDVVKAWGERERYHVSGDLGGARFRGVVEKAGNRFVLAMGPSWRRSSGLEPGDEIEAVFGLEGPQREDLAPDIAAALEADPEAAAFFDSLAQFYRKAYLRWIDATKRSPAIRAARIAETVRLLRNGIKQPGG